ncbi:MAG: hypothetical protein HYZ29_12525 [Myxococcales bacterium]|nr:hypothetical protein [Myxococcales bacterium]
MDIDLRLRIVALGAALALAGCSSPTDDDDERQGELVGGTGPLPGAIQGLYYRAGDHEGYTDAAGTFRYRRGDSVRFSLGALAFEPTPGARWLSPFQLASGSGCAVGAPLTRALQVLHSLDVDGDPGNGLVLPELLAPDTFVAVTGLDDAQLASAITAVSPGAKPVAADGALDAFIRQIDDEEWTQEDGWTFVFPDSVYHGQGVASDGKSWIFSSANHLLRSGPAFEELATNPQPVPKVVRDAGGKHIGDIDVHEGLLYAPIEDAPAFEHPYIVTYDAKTLEPTGDNRLLPKARQPDGVPWVAIDGPRRRLYTAEWDPTDHINVYDLDDLAFVEAIPLSPAIGRIQGAKVFGGQLYASSDDEQKSVYKIDLDTGKVMKRFALGTPNSEAEGLALTQDEDGARAHVLNVVIPNVELARYLRTRAPLRDSICP